MTRRGKLNLALAGALVVLLVVVWWRPGRNQMPIEPPRLTALTPDRVQHIVIRLRDQPALELRRERNQWTLQLQGRVLPAAQWRVENILRLLITPSNAQLAVTPSELAKFDLDPPLLQVQYDDLTIALGALETLSNRRYTYVNGTLHLVEDKLYRQLAGDPLTLVDLQLLPGKPALKGVDLGPWRASLDSGGAWQAHGAAEGSADAVTAFVDEWRYAQALSVRRIDPKIVAKRQVVIYTADNQTVRFGLAAADHEWWFLRDDLGLMYQMPADVVQRLTDLGPHVAAQRR